MATWTYGNGTHNTTAGNKTAIFTPAVSDLLVAITMTSGIAGGTTAVTDNNSSGTYTEVFGTDWTTGVNTSRMNAWVRTALVPAASSTTVTATQASSTGGGLFVYRLSGMALTGISAVRSSGGQSSLSSATPAPTLSLTPLTANACLGGILQDNSDTTDPAVPSGWSLTTGLAYATPTQGGVTYFRNSGQTSATVTWGDVAAGTSCVLVLEMDTTAAAGTLIYPSRKSIDHLLRR